MAATRVSATEAVLNQRIKRLEGIVEENKRTIDKVLKLVEKNTKLMSLTLPIEALTMEPTPAA